METTTTVYGVVLGMMEKNMKTTTTVYWCYIGE